MAQAMKRPAAIAIAAGLALTGALSTSTLVSHEAFAQSPKPPGDGGTAAQSANTPINPAQTGTLTINKRINADQTKAATGQTDDAPGGVPMQGANFKVTKINLDITKAADYARAVELSKKPWTARELLVQDSAQELDPTNAEGVATATNLGVGAYYVEELAPAENAQFGGTEVSKTGFVTASPFIVLLPMTIGEGEQATWHYNPVVYPKNSGLTTVKTVEDDNKHPSPDGTYGDGRTLNYQIDSRVPVLQNNRVLTKFNVVDTYNSQELTNVQVLSVEVGTLTDENTLTTPQTLNLDEHYTVVDGTVANRADGLNTTKTIVLTSDGLAILRQQSDLEGEQVVRVRLSADVNQVGNGQLEDGEVINSAKTTGATRETDLTVDGVPPTPPEETPPGGETPPPPPETPFETPEDKVRSYFGKVVIDKEDEDDNLIDGEVVFDLYRVRVNNDTSPTAQTVCGDQATLPDRAEERDNGVSTIKTGITFTGRGEINALHVTDYYNDAEPVNTQDWYCLVETKAPDGFLPLDAPVAFQLTRAQVIAPGNNMPDALLDQVDQNGESEIQDLAQGFTPQPNGAGFTTIAPRPLGDTVAPEVTRVAYVAEIENRERPPFTLPNTGGMGVLLLIAAGLMVAATGAYAARRNAAK